MGHDETSTPTRHQFYLVVVQYTAKLSAQKISAAVTRLMPAGKKLSRARCNMAVAPEEVRDDFNGPCYRPCHSGQGALSSNYYDKTDMIVSYVCLCNEATRTAREYGPASSVHSLEISCSTPRAKKSFVLGCSCVRSFERDLH